MSASRASARIARRELRRRPATTLLVALLVAVPVATMLVGVVLVRSQRVPSELGELADVGRADASLSVAAPRADEARAAITAAAPDVVIATVQAARGSLTPPGGDPLLTTVTSGDFADPLIRDRYVVEEGRMPSAAGEVALTPAIADAWHVRVGDPIAIPELELDATVVGIATTVARGGSAELFAGSFPALDPATVTTQLFVDEPFGLRAGALVALQQMTNGTGVLLLAGHVEPVDGVAFMTSNRSMEHPAVTELYVAGVWGGGALTLAVMGVVISSAFAISARRQLRTLGLLAASGAPPRVVRGSVVWQGFWVGVVGTAIGMVLGLVGVAVLRARGSSLVPFGPDQWAWTPRDLVPIALLGIVAPMAAATLPARTAARISVLQSLAGRRPLPAVRPRLVIGGVVSAIVGLGLLAMATVGIEIKPWRQNVWIALGIAGGLAVLAGAVAAAPVVVGIAGALARWTRGTPMLALRSVGRQRARFGAVVAGIAAAAALCLAVSAGVRASEVQTERRATHPADDVVKVDAWGSTTVFPSALITPDASGMGFGAPATYAAVTSDQFAAIAAIVPGAARIDTPIAHVRAGDTSARDDTISTYLTRLAPQAAPASDALLDGLHAPDEVRAALAAGEVVALGAPAELRTVTLAGWLGNTYPAAPAPTPGLPPAGQPIEVTPFPGVEVGTGLPSILLPAGEAERVGLRAAPAWDAATLFVTPDPLSPDQVAALRRLLDEQRPTGNGFVLADRAAPAPADPIPTPEAPASTPVPELRLSFPGDRPPQDQTAVLVVLAAIALGFTALVVILGLALAARDTRDERDVLDAVGAPPKVLRRLAGARAAILAGLGALVAVPTGLLPVWVVNASSTPAIPIVVPWASLAAVVVAIPVVIGLGAFAGGAVTSWRRPVTASMFASD